MKKSIILSSIAGAVLLGSLSSNVNAVNANGEADGIWLKQKFVAKGYEMDNITGAMTKKSFISYCYSKLVWDNSTGYVLDTYCQTDGTGAYTAVSLGESHMFSITPELATAVDSYIHFSNKSGNKGTGFGTPILKITFDSSHNVSSVTLKNLGGSLSGKLDPNTNNSFIGTFTSSGKSIPDSELPF